MKCKIYKCGLEAPAKCQNKTYIRVVTDDEDTCGEYICSGVDNDCKYRSEEAYSWEG